jgi:hypothetical protein
MNMVEDVISKPTLAAEDVSRYLAATPSFF